METSHGGVPKSQLFPRPSAGVAGLGAIANGRSAYTRCVKRGQGVVRDKDWYLLLGHVDKSPDPTHQGHLKLGKACCPPAAALEAQGARGCHTLTSVSSEFVCDSFFWGSTFTTLSTSVVPTRMASRWATVLVSGNKMKL